MPLAVWQGVAVFLLQEGANRLIERVLVVSGAKRTGDQPALGVADVLGHLLAQRALAESRQPLTQCVEIRAGPAILGAKRIHVAEEVLVDERR